MPTQVFAFGARVHREITREAYRPEHDRKGEAVGCPATDLGAFLGYIHDEIGSSRTEDARRFLEHWPSPDEFDARAAKGFLDFTLARDVRVAGVDFLPCEDDGTAIGVLVTESVRPDLDGRNQSRREIVEGVLGPIPEDPIVLDLGGLSGLASQAHAHYLLAEDPGGWLARGGVARRLRSGPLDLWRDPAHFAIATAVPGGPFTLGADMAMEHFLLALLAASWPDPASRRLSLAFLGHALHYVQDAADPLHTVQVGHPCVVLHGAAAFAGRALVTGGGYMGSLAGPTSVIADKVSNLHLWTEALWDEAGVVPGGGVWTAAWGEVARAFPGDLDSALLAAWRAAEAGRTRGPALYGAACRAVSPEVLEYGAVLKDGEFDPMALLADEEAGRDVTRIGREAATVALAESAAVLRAYEVLAPRMADPGARRVVAALLASRMRAVAQREARQSAWKVDHPNGVPPGTGPVRIPAILVLEAVMVLLGFAIGVRRIRRVRARRAPSRGR